MAMKVDYVARETASNLTRNITISIATILTVTVSLFLVGFSMMVSQGVRNAKPTLVVSGFFFLFFMILGIWMIRKKHL